MRQGWLNLDDRQRTIYGAVKAFLNGRLEERETVEWALGLENHDTTKRLALIDLINSRFERSINEPWRSAWLLIEESLNNPHIEHCASTDAYDIQHRLRTGDRSGALVTAIAELVTPRLELKRLSGIHLYFREPPTRPKKINDLFSAGLTSGNLIDPTLLDLESLKDHSFLLSLANALDATVNKGIDIARRIGWDGQYQYWKVGKLYRVYYVPSTKRDAGDHEPDEFNQGIAPSVKLLHAVVTRLGDIDIDSAIGFVRRWKVTNSVFHLRLWAALSRGQKITPADEVGAILLELDDQQFWKLDYYPEIAELRALRFSEFDLQEQRAITTRIRKRPPRSLWPRKADGDHVKNARLYSAARELRRIEVAGAVLPQSDKSWLEARADEFPKLGQMLRIDADFLKAQKARIVPRNPDSRYDSLAGEQRLKALESALSSTRGRWDDDAAERARGWIMQPENHIGILTDLESTTDSGANFTRTWNQFGSSHLPGTTQGKEATQPESPVEAARVLKLLVRLPETSAAKAIDGLTRWLCCWKNQVVDLPHGLTVWFKLWPIAVEATNAIQPIEKEIDLNTLLDSRDDHTPRDPDPLDTTPVGNLIDVFLVACPHITGDDHPFEVDGAPRIMRDAIVSATGRSKLIVRYQLIEQLPYFLNADRDWTQVHLIEPLNNDDQEAETLWSAIARRTHFTKVLKIIGHSMAERAMDRRLDRQTRKSFVFSLVVESLHAYIDKRDPTVPRHRITQMLRSVEDEIRVFAAEAIQRFVRDVSASDDDQPAPLSAGQLFRTSAAPFLKEVWPQERSIVTPGISRALADLPTTAQEAFVEAVNAIERFLVPFDCWSMIEYGLSGEKDGEAILARIDNKEMATAFLRLLDSTIGTSEGAVVPIDLPDALDQLRKVAPKLVETQEFRRLAAAARRYR